MTAAVDHTILSAIDIFSAIMDQYYAKRGTLTPEQWRGLVSSALEDTHTAAALIAAGATDIDHLTAEQFAALVLRVKDQNAYLTKFATDLPGLSEAAARARMDLYAGALRGTEAAVATAEWPVEWFPGVGVRCGPNCRCSGRLVVLSYEQGDADYYWDVLPGESCEDCLSRGQRSPVQIRGGVWLN